MKITNISGEKSWNVGFCKNGKMAKWNDKVTPIKVTIDGTQVQLFANFPTSDYIYFLFEGIARFIWCKDGIGSDILTLKKLKCSDLGRVAVLEKAIRIEADEVVDAIATETKPDINGERRKAIVVIKKASIAKA